MLVVSRYTRSALVQSLLSASSLRWVSIGEILGFIAWFLFILSLPLRIGCLDAQFHLFERVLKHGGELGTHVTEMLGQLSELLLLLLLGDVLEALKSLDFLLKAFDFLIVGVPSLVEVLLRVGQLFLGRFILARHVRHNVVLGLLSLFLHRLVLHIVVPFLILTGFRRLGSLGDIRELTLQGIEYSVVDKGQLLGVVGVLHTALLLFLSLALLSFLGAHSLLY